MSSRTRSIRTLILSAVIVAMVAVAAWVVGSKPWRSAGELRTAAALEEAAVAEARADDAAEAEVEPRAGSDQEEVRWDLPVLRNDRVDHWIDYLTGEKRDKMRLWLERSGRYGPLIQARLRERGMPQDLLYLALIESGFSPRAYSRAHAVGIWQFIAGTGRRYGLDISSHVDERRDPIKATDAALDYLEDLHEQFGSWYLAAAAYNTGENRVERLLRRHAGGQRGDEDLYWRIRPHLPRETRAYVPLMLAAGHIAKEPEKYGFRELEYQEPLRFDVVEVPGATSLGAVAEAAGTDEERVRGLNPHLVSGMTPPGRSWQVRIPDGRRRGFARSFERLSEEQRQNVARHVVRHGETLGHIAQRYGTSVSRIRATNGWVNPRRLQVGQRLQIPVGAGSGSSAAADRADNDWRVHRVQRGDTLWGIARRYNVSVRQLRAWNELGQRSRILPGQQLRIRA